MTTFDQELSSSLQTLQIPTHMKGYAMITTAINLINSKPSYIQSIVKLYTKTGELHKASPRCVEGNIRNALQCAKSDFHIQFDVLGTNRELCTIEFLATLYRAIVIKVADREAISCGN